MDWHAMTTQSNSFQSFFYSNKDENSLPSNVIWVIKEDVYGILWIGTNSGLCSFDKKNKRFQRFIHDDHSNSISGNYINDVEFAPDGKMWITTSNGLNCLDVSTKNSLLFFMIPTTAALIRQ